MSQIPSPNTPHFQTYTQGGLDHVGFDRFHQNCTKARSQIPQTDVCPSSCPKQENVGQLLCLKPAGSPETQVPHPLQSIPKACSQNTATRAVAALLAETPTHLCNVPGVKLWTHSYRTWHGAQGRSQQQCYRCVILSWALTQGSLQRNCSIQPKSRNKRCSPRFPAQNSEKQWVSLWTRRNYFFLQTPPCP